jgi:tetratricopeptide (TPR) repeat protein
MNRLLFTLCVAVALAPGADVDVAHAETASERAARRHYERGKKLFNLQKFDEALVEFQKAYDADPIPDFLFNIGQCQRNLGDYQAAIFSFKNFLKSDPETERRDQVARLIEELERKVDEDDTARLGLGKQPKPGPTEAERPVYKKWWFWTGVAVVSVGAVGIYAATADGTPKTTLGNVVLP